MSDMASGPKPALPVERAKAERRRDRRLLRTLARRRVALRLSVPEPGGSDVRLRTRHRNRPQMMMHS